MIEFRVVVPDGVNGQAGFRIEKGGAQVYPATPAAFVVSNDDKLPIEVAHAPQGGLWQLVAFNTGGFDHTFHVLVYVDEYVIASTPALPRLTVPVVL